MKVCSIEGCEKKAVARGWCDKHWSRWRRNGDPEKLVRVMLPCSIEGCSNTQKARTWCSKHFQRWWKYGDPLITKSQLSPSDHKRFWSKVDKNGLNGCWVWTDPLNNGYGKFNPTFGKPAQAHRYSYSEFVGPILSDRPLIDHICRNRACVNPDHLRAVTAAENAQNVPVQRNSKSGLRGVQYDPQTRKWFGTVNKMGQRAYTPRFSTIAEADRAVRELRRQIFTHSVEDWQEQPGTGDQVHQREKVISA